MKHIAVVGGSLAGISAARGLRELGYDGRLTVVGAEAHRPYDRPPLSKDFLAGSATVDALSLEMPDEDLGAEWLLGTPAVALDPRAGRLTLADGSHVAADGFVLATGASARPWPASQLAGVHTLRTLDDALALRADLQPGAKLVVIGAGFIGAEVASTARSLGLDVTVVEVAETPLAAPLGPRLGAAVAALHEANGVHLICGVGVTGLGGDGQVRSVELADGRRLAADVVVVGIGAVPEIDWLAGSGVEVSGAGVLCDAAGGTSVPDVVAVGDCSVWYDPAHERYHRIEHWTAARDRGVPAAASLLGVQAPAVRGGGVPYFWSDQYGVRIQFAGHARPDDDVSIDEGDLDSGSFIAVYRREGHEVAVLGVDRVRSFVRWRRQLAAGSSALGRTG